MNGSRVAAWTRRRFGVAVPGALAAVWSATHEGAARTKKKKRKKKTCPSPDLCPVRGCCECHDAPDNPILCTLVAATTEEEIIGVCEAICATGTTVVPVTVQPGTTLFCRIGNRCTRLACPVSLESLA